MKTIKATAWIGYIFESRKNHESNDVLNQMMLICQCVRECRRPDGLWNSKENNEVLSEVKDQKNVGYLSNVCVPVETLERVIRFLRDDHGLSSSFILRYLVVFYVRLVSGEYCKDMPCTSFMEFMFKRFEEKVLL